jgi:type IV pilus assembly protein PilY1
MFSRRNSLGHWHESPYEKKLPFSCRKGTVSVLRLSLLLFLLFQSGFAGAQVGDGDRLPSVSFPKSSFDLGAEFELFSSDPPNILLFLDTSGRMLWTSEGNPPGKYPYDPYLDLDLDHCTYGDGSRPWRYDGRDQERWGRDLDSENNLTPEIALDETRREAFLEENYHPNLLWKNNGNTPPSGYPSHFSDADLAPNDSRMYKAKMILTRILSDPSLVRETNIAFATYKQQRITAWADFYLRPPYRLGSWITNPYSTVRNDSEYVRWGVLHTDQRSDNEAYRRAMLRSEFLAVGKNDDPSVKLAPLLTLIDGIENTGDDEIKADGACPLAGSIAGSAYTARDSDSNNLPTGTIEQFFKRKAAIASRCQANWLVLFVYGQDTSRNGDPVAAVEALSRDTAVLGTRVMEKGVRTMVVGFLDPEAQPELAATLDAMAKKGNPEASNAHAYLSDNVSELLKAFRIVFRSIKDVSGANSAPVVRPPLKGEREGHYFIAAYTTKQNDQWEGHLYRHAISIDVSGKVLIGEVPLWDAGERLDRRKGDTRRVYTVDWDFSQSSAAGGALSGSNMVAFDTGNASVLRDEMGLSTARALQLTSWVRGTDVWNPDAGGVERWKLADMFGSDIVVVGPPRGTYPDRHYKTFAVTHRNRKSQVYVQSNGGLLHAFDFETGDEAWAFIPPNVLRFNRLVGLVSDDLSGWPSGTGTNRSISRFLLDGPLVVEDMKIGGEYRTVLLGSLGRGGYGVYALDVTEADTPRFLWATEYNGYASRTPPFPAAAVNKATHYMSLWRGKDALSGEAGSDYRRIDLDRIAGRKSPPVDLSLTPEEAGFDYRDLRFPVGAPVLGSVRCDSSWNNRDAGICWIGLLAGGAASASEVSGASGAVYVTDMTDGRIVGVPMRTEGMAYAPPSAYTFRNDNVLEGFFLGTSEGVIHRGVFDGSLPRATSLEKVFVLELPGKDGVLRRVGVPFALEVTLRNDEDIWLFGGTRDVPAASGTLDNDGQCFFAVNTGGASSFPIRTAELAALDPDATAFSSNNAGWYIPLYRSATTEEYVTDMPKIAGGVLFVSTFTPDPNVSAANCSVTGSSRIFIVDAFSGKGLWNAAGKKSLRLDGVKVTGVQVASTQTAEGEKHQVYLGVTNLEKKPFSDPALQGLNLQENPGVLVFDVPEEARKVMDANRRYVPGVPVIQYWRDVFNR